MPISKNSKLAAGDFALVTFNTTQDVIITTGRWDVPLFSIRQHSPRIWYLSTCCPCIPLAQIKSRLDGTFEWALMWYGTLICSMWVCCGMVLSNHTTGASSSSLSSTEEYKEPATQHWAALAVVLTVFVYLFNVWRVRSATRRRFEIPGRISSDALASICCSCCTIAQLATQVKINELGICRGASTAHSDTLAGYII